MKSVLTFLLVSVVIIKCNADLCADIANGLRDDISQKCRTQLTTICNNGTLLFRMYDASSKYPIPGVAYSRNMDFGNFDECVTFDYEDYDGRIMGKYCALTLLVYNPYVPAIDQNDTMILGASHSQGGHLSDYIRGVPLPLPRADFIGTTSMLSMCIPDQCTDQEVGADLAFSGQPPTPGLVVAFAGGYCQTKETYTEYEWYDILMICFMSFVLFLMVLSTAYDLLLRRLKKKANNPIYLAFSVMTNGEKLFHISTNTTEQIQCLNGLRFVSMMWVIAGHNIVVYQNLALTNKQDFDDWYVGRLSSQYIRSAPIAVDTFFFLSGLLLAYGYLKSASTHPIREITKIPMMIVHRYLRLTPALAVLFFFSLTLYRKLGAGPLWMQVTEDTKTMCTDHWWGFFLYIQNYVNFKDMCLNHTWYLSADMQMFILSPLVLIPIAVYRKRNLKMVMIALGFLIVLATGFPMLPRFLDHLIENVYDTHSRFVDYLIGVFIGVILRETKDKPFYFTKIQNLCIWAFFLLADIAFCLYYNDVLVHYEHTKDTLFYGLYRPLWCTSLAWMVYSCFYGQGGVISWILTRPVFQVGGKLSYCMYLLHGSIQIYWLAVNRSAKYFSDYIAFYSFCGHFILTMLLAALWVLAFESPMISIERFIFGGFGAPKRRPKPEPEPKIDVESKPVE